MHSPIIFFGPLPPPYGGVSVHLDRLSKILVNEKIDHCIINQYGSTKSRFIFNFLKCLLIKKTVHLHLVTPLILFLLFLLPKSLKSNLYVTLHNDRMLDDRFSMLWLFMLKRLKTRACILVSKRMYRALSGEKIDWMHNISAYLPPDKTLLLGDTSRRLILNIWSCDNEKFYEYGIDIFLKLVLEIQNVSAHIFLGKVSDREFLESKILNMAGSDAAARIRVVCGENLIEHLASGDILVRPNRVDAYGVSVKEFIDLGLPALASDVCVRPRGARVCSDYAQFKNEIIHLINQNITRDNLHIEEDNQDLTMLLRLYKSG